MKVQKTKAPQLNTRDSFLPSMLLSLGRDVGGAAGVGWLYGAAGVGWLYGAGDGLTGGKGSNLLSTGLTFSTDSVLKQKEYVRYIQERRQHVSTVCLAGLTVPGERICDLGLRFGRLMEAIDSSVGLIHGLVVKAAAVKIWQLLPVILFIFLWVIVVGADHVVPYTRVRFLGLWGSRSRKENHQKESS